MELRSGYKKTEVGIIPKDWEVKELGEIGDVKMCRRVFNHETTSNGVIPFYKIGTFGKEADAYISKDLYKYYRQRFSFPIKGDILISAAGTIGRTIIYNGEDAYYQDSNIVWIENNQSIISNGFLYHIFQVVKYRTEGGTIQRLYNSILKATKFASPPKSEQTAIATALSDADALISSLEKLIDKKRKLKQGVMQRLLKPKEGWEVRKLGEMADIVRGASPRPIEDPIWFDNKSRIGWVRISDVTKSIKYLYETVQKLSEEGIKNSRLVKKGNLIMSICATVGRPMITTFEVCIHDGFVVFRNPRIDLNYLYYYLSFIEPSWSKSGQTGSQMNLNTKIINTTIINLPRTIDEQVRIANILSDIDKELLRMDIKLNKIRNIKSGMMQNLLTGKIRLVKQEELKAV